jgi:hypothetical protein
VIKYNIYYDWKGHSVYRETKFGSFTHATYLCSFDRAEEADEFCALLNEAQK